MQNYFININGEDIMLAFIKDNKLVVNTQIHESEKDELLDFIENIDGKQVISEKLYDIDGNVYGIAFKEAEI
jgi:hypothetical protein